MNDLRYALRQLARRPRFAAVIVGTLALGIGAATGVFSVVRGVLFRPLPYAAPDELVMVFRTVPRFGFDRSTASYPDYADWREQATSAQAMAATQYRRPVLTGAGEPTEVTGVRATASLWTVLGVAPVAGRVFGPDDDRPGAEPVLVIAAGLAERAFGSAGAAVGQDVMLDGDRYTVIGVMPRHFYYPTPDYQFWEPLRPDPAQLERDANFLSVIARLASGVTLERAQAELSDLAARIDAVAPGANEGYGVRVEQRLGFVVREVRTALWVLFGAVTLVLAIACANAANLLLVRGVRRRREFAVRTALGGSRAHLLRGLVAEGTVLGLAAGAVGLVLASLIGDGLVALAPDLPRAGEVRMDLAVFGYAAVVSLVTGVLFGLAPATRILRHDPQATLKGEGTAGATSAGGGRRFQGTLVVAQVGLAIVLVVGSTVLARHFLDLTGTAPGFRTEGILTARLTLPADRYPAPDERRAFLRVALERTGVLPGVAGVAATAALPFSGATFGRLFVVEGQPLPAPGDEPSADYSIVFGDYFRTMEIPLLSGRGFGPEDDTDAVPVAVINATMARRFWPGEDPLGKRFKPGDVDGDSPWITVVGVAADVRTRRLDEEVPPGWSQPLTQVGWPTTMFVVARTDAEPEALAPSLRGALAQLDPALPISDVSTLGRRVDASVAQPRMRTLVLAAFAGLASVLALLGLYSVMAFLVVQRTRDLGVRMALGADRRRVVVSVLRPGLRLVVLGTVVGLAGAAASDRVLRALVPDVAPTDPTVYAAVTLFLGACALLGCWLPARRAARIDPMEALRHE